MKKAIAIILIFYYSYSFAGPYIPVFYNFISKILWEQAHKERVSSMSPHSDILTVLKDMADHNSPKKSNIPAPDSLIPVTFSYLDNFPSFDFLIFPNKAGKKLSKIFPGNLPVIFQKNPSPPPEFF